MKIGFILDRIPSYLVVISRLRSAEKKSDPSPKEVAQDEAMPAKNDDVTDKNPAINPDEGVIFRILSLSTNPCEDDTLNISTASPPHPSKSRKEPETPSFLDKSFSQGGAVPTPSPS